MVKSIWSHVMSTVGNYSFLCEKPDMVRTCSQVVFFSYSTRKSTSFILLSVVCFEARIKIRSDMFRLVEISKLVGSWVSNQMLGTCKDSLLQVQDQCSQLGAWSISMLEIGLIKGQEAKFHVLNHNGHSNWWNVLKAESRFLESNQVSRRLKRPMFSVLRLSTRMGKLEETLSALCYKYRKTIQEVTRTKKPWVKAATSATPSYYESRVPLNCTSCTIPAAEFRLLGQEMVAGQGKQLMLQVARHWLGEQLVKPTEYVPYSGTGRRSPSTFIRGLVGTTMGNHGESRFQQIPLGERFQGSKRVDNQSSHGLLSPGPQRGFGGPDTAGKPPGRFAYNTTRAIPFCGRRSWRVVNVS